MEKYPTNTIITGKPSLTFLLIWHRYTYISDQLQGIENKQYFGFICRERGNTNQTSPTNDAAGPGPSSGNLKPVEHGYVAYVFRCESDCVAGDILKGMNYNLELQNL